MAAPREAVAHASRLLGRLKEATVHPKKKKSVYTAMHCETLNSTKIFLVIFFSVLILFWVGTFPVHASRRSPALWDGRVLGRARRAVERRRVVSGEKVLRAASELIKG